MAAVSQYGAISHLQDVRLVDHVGIARDGDEDLSHPTGLHQGHDLVSVHGSFQCGDGPDLRDYDVRAEPLSSPGYPFATPAIAADHYLSPCPEYVGCPGDAVHSALPGSVTVVEKVFGLSVVYGDDRVDELACCSHVPQPDHSRGRLLGPATDIGSHFGIFLVQSRDQVCPVIHGHIGPVLQGGDDVPVVSLVILSFYGIHRHSFINQGSGHVILRR